MVTDPVPRSAAGRLNQDIANAVVRCHKRLLGRGPMKAQAFFRNNFVVVVLETAMTEAERRLAENGDRDSVLEMRQLYQQAMRDDLVAAVEQLTARKVEAFLTANHIAPDVATHVFVLDQPVAGEPAETAPQSG